jgi:hypothetical protein
MKIFGAVGTAVIFLAFGPLSGFAQQPEPDKPARQEEPKEEHPKAEHPKEQKQAEPQKREEPKPAEHPQQQDQRRAKDSAKQAQENQKRGQDQQHHTQEQNQKAQQQNQRAQQKTRDDAQKKAQQDQDRQAHDIRSNPAQSQGRSAAYHGRIPESNFHEHFGREHHFRFQRPQIIDGRSRFQYSGYWFELVDPWPADWGYDDDVYVDYEDDQYYLFDPEHSGARIVINVVL